jgi:hypothetical protein
MWTGRDKHPNGFKAYTCLPKPSLLQSREFEAIPGYYLILALKEEVVPLLYKAVNLGEKLVYVDFSWLSP